jgi:dGTPase
MDPHAHPGPVASAYAARRREFEDAWLSPLAARSWPPRRARPEEDCGLRTPLQRDRDRIVHSKAFRRLKHKTQVFVAPEGDHFRTRLTHTLEVTQISRTVARALRLNEDLTEAIGLGHDLGHPAFGHIGEDVLDDCLRRHFDRGFRHYEHSLRVVDVLELDGKGLNLCEDVRDGIARHSGRAPLPRTLEGRIVRLVDRVAYINHDIDDALRAGVLREEELPAEPIAGPGRHRPAPHRRPRARPRRALRAWPATSSRATRSAAPWTACGPSCSTTSTSVPSPGASTPRSTGSSAPCSSTTSPSPTGSPTAAARRRRPAQRVTDWLAGMTDRYCIRAFEALSVPEAFAL